MPIFDSVTLGRDLVLILNSGVVFYTTLFAAILVTQWLRGPIRRFTDVRLAWSVFLGGMALNSFSFIMADFYFTTPLESMIWTKAGYIAMMIALIGFAFALERILPYRVRHIFTGSLVVVTALTALAPRDWLTALALVASLLAFAMLFLFFRHFIKNTTGQVRSSIGLILAGFAIGFFGYLARSDFIYYTLGEPVYLIGALMLVAGLLLMGIAILGSPALDELDWSEQMLELYVIHSSGLLLYHHRFVDAVTMNEDLTAAGIAGVQSLFMEITKSAKGLNYLSIDDFEILFAQGTGFITVLLSRKRYRVLLDMVADFVEKFERLFSDRLLDPPELVGGYDQASGLISLVFTPPSPQT